MSAKASQHSRALVRHSSRASGFSTIELLVVLAMIVTVTAISLPTITTVLTAARVRGAMGSISTLFQNGRSMAVRQNTLARIRFQLSNSRWYAYVDNGASPAGLTTASPQFVLPAQMSKVAAPTSGTPTPLDNASCGTNSLSTLDTVDDTYFNQLGIPCQYTSGTCSGGQAFAYYFSYQSGFGGTNWAALCVSPAGRMKAWYWTGSSWTN